MKTTATHSVFVMLEVKLAQITSGGRERHALSFLWLIILPLLP